MNRKLNNKLLEVVNTASGTSQSMTYDYDDIGNLVKDSDAEIDTVYWGVNGKMKGILRSSGSTKEGLAFDYDPSGNRIAKHVYKTGGQLAL
ncbi:MAG: hypothetical protein IPJ66_20035 [Bacteroidetes bacterium]|nr:hypothetical protein [Bacteroidota bacterium]